MEGGNGILACQNQNSHEGKMGCHLPMNGDEELLPYG